MWVYQYQPLLNGLLQKALVELCTQSLPWEGRLEIDGIFCVSGRDPSQQIVIKIHKALEKPEPKSRVATGGPAGAPDKKVLIEAGKIVSSQGPLKSLGANKKTAAASAKKSSPLPLNLSLPNLKSGASSLIHTSPAQHNISLSSAFSSLSKTLTVNNQSLRALLGNKAPTQTAALQESPASHAQVSPLALEGAVRELDVHSDSGSVKRKDAIALESVQVKQEPQDAESESSLDLDEEALFPTNATCKICSITFENFQSLQSHTLETHKRYACRQCCNTFSLRCNLRRHERLHAGVKPHTCHLCKKSFSRSADLKAHLKKHLAQKSPDLLSCSKCPKSFSNAVNLRLHMFKVHKERDCVYVCSICEKVYHNAEEFQQHRQSHTDALLQGAQTPLPGQTHSSACSTPVLNGSQGSLGDDTPCSDVDESELSRLEDELKSQDGAQMAQDSPMDSQSSTDAALSAADTTSQDMGLYFGSPLVIKEENDSNDAESLKRSNRRKSKPNKFVSQEPPSQLPLVENAENLEPDAALPDNVSEGSAHRQDGLVLTTNLKRHFGEWAAEDGNAPYSPEPKRTCVESALGEGFGMAEQSLEDIMKQVNENLYRNKDVLRAEETEKENEKKKKPKPSKPKGSQARKSTGGGQKVSKPVTPRQGADKLEATDLSSKSHTVLFVSSTPTPGEAPTSAGVGTPKVPIPKMSLVKQEASTWSVSPKVKQKKDNSFSPIPYDQFMKASREADSKEFACGQWGCTFQTVGFQSFEEHTLLVHGRYPCKFCSQTFTGRNNRTRHIRYHMTGKQHQCSDCSKFFARPDSLKEHRFIHTKSYRDSNCVNCKIFFEKKATLLSHMKKCFSDEQLMTDKLTPEEIEKESSFKKESSKEVKKESVCVSPSAPALCPSPSTPALVPSDVGVMKAEYLLKEKQKIMDVQNYLDSQMAAIDDGLAPPTAPGSTDGGLEEEDEVTVIDLDAMRPQPPRSTATSEADPDSIPDDEGPPSLEKYEPQGNNPSTTEHSPARMEDEDTQQDRQSPISSEAARLFGGDSSLIQNGASNIVVIQPTGSDADTSQATETPLDMTRPTNAETRQQTDGDCDSTRPTDGDSDITQPASTGTDDFQATDAMELDLPQRAESGVEQPQPTQSVDT